MVLSVGLISAVILNKKRPGYRTKLQKLTDKLKRSPLTHLTLYEIPLQKIITISCISLFILFIVLISHQATVELSGTHHNPSHQRLTLNSNQCEFEICKAPHKQIAFPLLENKSDRMSSMEQNNLRQSGMKTSFLSKTVWWIIVGYGFTILALISQTKAKRCHFFNKNHSTTTLAFTQFSLLPLFTNSITYSITASQYKQMSIKIYKKGEQRFTNNNSVFCVVLSLLTTNKESAQIQLIKRGSIFDARKATIQICSVFSIKPDWQIYSDILSEKKNQWI